MNLFLRSESSPSSPTSSPIRVNCKEAISFIELKLQSHGKLSTGNEKCAGGWLVGRRVRGRASGGVGVNGRKRKRRGDDLEGCAAGGDEGNRQSLKAALDLLIGWKNFHPFRRPLSG